MKKQGYDPSKFGFKEFTVDKLVIEDHGSPGSQTLGDDMIDPFSQEWQDLAGEVEPGGIVELGGCECSAREISKNNEISIDGVAYIEDLSVTGKRTVVGNKEIVNYKDDGGKTSSPTHRVTYPLPANHEPNPRAQWPIVKEMERRAQEAIKNSREGSESFDEDKQ